MKASFRVKTSVSAGNGVKKLTLTPLDCDFKPGHADGQLILLASSEDEQLDANAIVTIEITKG
jgi:hypothetical protein